MEQAGKAVRQLGSLLFEMEVLRSFLETEAELRYFDNRVSPGKVLAHRVVNNLKGVYSFFTDFIVKIRIFSGKFSMEFLVFIPS